MFFLMWLTWLGLHINYFQFVISLLTVGVEVFFENVDGPALWLVAALSVYDAYSLSLQPWCILKYNRGPFHFPNLLFLISQYFLSFFM